MSFSFQPLEARGTIPLVVERIVEPIRLGRLRYGDRLPSERALAQQLSVSRETVRKAVRTLVDAGVLEVTSGRGSMSGIHVRSDLIPPELLPGPARVPIGEISGVLEARRVFEPRVAQLAGLLATEDDFAGPAGHHRRAARAGRRRAARPRARRSLPPGPGARDAQRDRRRR